MVMDAQGISELFSTDNPLPPLERIGYGRQYINELAAAGIKFNFVIFKASDGVLPATWKNLGKFISKNYGSNHTVTKLYKKYIYQLSSFNFEELKFRSQKKRGFNRNVTSKNIQPNASLWTFRSWD